MVRARITLLDVDDREARATLGFGVAIEVEESPGPHIVAEWLGSAQKKTHTS